ncbi:MAG TPA: deoxyribonuclease IV, partial [Firmicutes bacterium]|nr:deoxyribonuclease IV [Bacillota bacterium]
MRIGIHMPVSGGFGKNLRRLKEYGCQAVQIFPGNPTGWRMAAADPVEIAQRVNLLQQLDISPLIIHCAYLINLASCSPGIHEKSTQLLNLTMERAALYCSPYVVLHTGNHVGEGVQRGLEKIADTINRELPNWPNGVQLLLENTSGSGTALGSRLEELASIVNNFPQNAVGVCLDTAHAWAAGYDISSSGGLEEMLDLFDELIGLPRLRVLHVNDSKVACGSKVDRHQHIGQGCIGRPGFAALLRFPWPMDMPL